MELSTQGSMGNNWYWRLFKMVVKSQKNPRTIAVVSINFSARPRDTFPCNGRSGSNICKKCTPQIVVHYSLLTTNVMFCWSRSRYCVNWPLIPDQNKTWSRSTLCWCIDSIVYRCASGPISVNSVRICEISRKSSISTRIQLPERSMPSFLFFWRWVIFIFFFWRNLTYHKSFTVRHQKSPVEFLSTYFKSFSQERHEYF